jgi:hypothetical protein
MVRVPSKPGRSRLTACAVAAIAAAILCMSCNYGEVVVVQPAAAAHGPLTLSIQVDPEDSAIARELGWTGGIPNAEVTVSPGNGDTATGPPVATLQADANGAVRVPDLPDGTYLVEVRRLLGTAEMAQLRAGEDVVGFMAKEMAKRGSATVRAPASHRRSLVISEWSFEEMWIPAASTWYDFGGFLELANNSDTTIYLDGIVIAEGYTVAADYSTGLCQAFDAYTNDPDGIWTHYFDSLPGTGHDYPLAPGAVAVIATDAIDHSGIAPAGLDLSHANFEFVGTSDADNPSVPNTVSLGQEEYWFGHGLFLNELLAEVVFIALPVDTSALPRHVMNSLTGRLYYRVPRARILDAIALTTTFQIPEPLCPHLVHRNFDRYRAQLLVDEPWNASPGLHSVQRKVAFTRADRRNILQHTRTTNADFFWGPRTPFQLP